MPKRPFALLIPELWATLSRERLGSGLIKFEGFPQPLICASLWLEVTMSEVFLLTTQQLNRIKPYFPVSHGVPRVDDQRDYLCDPVRPAMEGCTESLWSAQDTL